MNLIIFILVLSILVIVHEWGHFITAKLLGVRVQKFSVGFGKKLCSWQRGGTEFLICAIPLGGYVKLAGDERSECKGSSDEFYSHPVGHRSLIVLMGPIVNLIFAYLCFVFVFLAGFPTIPAKVGKVMDGYPGQVAGLLAGDKIVQVNSQKITHWEEMQKAVMSSQGKPLALTILRENVETIKTIVPKEQTHKNIFGEQQRAWLIGIQPKDEILLIKYGLKESFVKAGQQIVSITTTTFKALSRVVTGGMEAKDALAGPIRIFDIVKNAAQMGLSSLVYIVGIISTSLAIFNLFPIPVLDGGHLFFMAIEKLRGRPLPVKVEEGMIKFGFTVLMCLMVFVFYNDIVEVGWIDRIKGVVQSLKP